MACAESGKLTCINQEAADRPARSAEHGALENQGVPEGREKHRVGEELLLMLAEVQDRSADF